MIQELQSGRRISPFVQLLWAVGTTVLAAYLSALVKKKLDRQHEHRVVDARLDRDLEDSMDCSDPVARY